MEIKKIKPYSRNAKKHPEKQTLSDYQGFAWFIPTPRGFNYFYDLYNQQNEIIAGHCRLEAVCQKLLKMVRK